MALKSGINMSMSDEYYSKYLPGLIKSGKVTMEELDDAARHVLNVKYDMEAGRRQVSPINLLLC